MTNTTKTAKLSARMIAALRNHDEAGTLNHCDLATRKALETRGLIVSESHLAHAGYPSEYTYLVSQLTDAGRAVLTALA